LQHLVLRLAAAKQGMVDSGLGRTERRQVGKSRLEPRLPSKPEHGDVGQPRACLASVHAETLETLAEVCGDAPRTLCLVVEDDHADAAGLAVAERPKDRYRVDGRDSAAQRIGDGVDVIRRPRSEEGKRDVDVLSGNRPRFPVLQLALPCLERRPDARRQRERAEEAT
jgi:hypothetical protein